MAEGNNTFQVEIVTPDRVFYTGSADMIEFNTIDGQIGVYKNHIPMTTVIEPGVVIIHEEDRQKVAAIHDKVTLLAEVAEWPDEIDLNRAEAARDRAEERISVKAETTDLKRAEFALHKALTRINAAGYK